MAADTNYYDEYLKILNSGAKGGNTGTPQPPDLSGQSRLVAGDQSFRNSREYRQGKHFGLRSQRYQGRCFHCHEKGHIRRNCPRNGRLGIETLRRERDYFCSQLQFYMSLTNSLQEDKRKLEERIALENMQIFSVMHNSAILQNQILLEISQLKMTSMAGNYPEVEQVSNFDALNFNGVMPSSDRQEAAERLQADGVPPLLDSVADGIRELEIRASARDPDNGLTSIFPMADTVKADEIPPRGPGLALVEDRSTPELREFSSSIHPTAELQKPCVSERLNSGPNMALSSASSIPLSEQEEEWEEWNRNMKNIIEAEKREARNRQVNPSGPDLDPAALERAKITAAARDYVRNQRFVLNEGRQRPALNMSCIGNRVISGPDLALASVSTTPDPDLALTNEGYQTPEQNKSYPIISLTDLIKSCNSNRLTSGPDLALASVSLKPGPSLVLTSGILEPQKPIGTSRPKQKSRKKKGQGNSQRPPVHSQGWY